MKNLFYILSYIIVYSYFSWKIDFNWSMQKLMAGILILLTSDTKFKF